MPEEAGEIAAEAVAADVEFRQVDLVDVAAGVLQSASDGLGIGADALRVGEGAVDPLDAIQEVGIGIGTWGLAR